MSSKNSCEFLDFIHQMTKTGDGVYSAEGKSIWKVDYTTQAFEGQILAQALKIATETVPEGYTVHSLQCHFTNKVVVTHPIEYRVERVLERDAIVTRSVRGTQRGAYIITLSVMYWKDADVPLNHQHYDIPSVPGPELLKSNTDIFRQCIKEYPNMKEDVRITLQGYVNSVSRVPVDMRPVNPEFIMYQYGLRQKEIDFSNQRMRTWVKIKGNFDPSDVQLYQYIIAFFSDWAPVRTILFHDRLFKPRAMVAKNHSVWIHERFNPDQWLLFEVFCPKVVGGRGLTEGKFWTQDGRHVASFCEEILLRGRVIEGKL